jgi:hypothetical protein
VTALKLAATCCRIDKTWTIKPSAVASISIIIFLSNSLNVLILISYKRIVETLKGPVV